MQKWLIDPKRKIQERRIDAYLVEVNRFMSSLSDLVGSKTFVESCPFGKKIVNAFSTGANIAGSMTARPFDKVHAYKRYVSISSSLLLLLWCWCRC